MSVTYPPAVPLADAARLLGLPDRSAFQYAYAGTIRVRCRAGRYVVTAESLRRAAFLLGLPEPQLSF